MDGVGWRIVAVVLAALLGCVLPPDIIARSDGATAGGTCDDGCGCEVGDDCAQTCEPGEMCVFDCAEAGCTVTCLEGSTCDIYCPTGDCRMNCNDAVSCDMTCGPAATSCEGLCEDTNCTIDCHGGNCALRCMGGIVCSAD